jgi:glutamine amidotransferase
MTTRPVVAVLDYGIGNLHSARKALERGGADARLTTDVGLVRDAAGVVLPGVGAFGACMAALRRSGLEQAARDAADSGRPFLGICVGMQMLFTGSDENPGVGGLDVIPGRVRWIPKGPKIPQMQWNVLRMHRSDPVFDGIGDRVGDLAPWVYFDHSLHGVPDDADVVVASVEYGSTVNAAFRSGQVVATQFHPEKSSRPGLRLLANFVDVCASALVVR